jgi:hypothetical protein
MACTRTVYPVDINDIRLNKTGLSIGREGSPNRMFLSLGREPDETDVVFLRKVYQAGRASKLNDLKEFLEI